ncbi:sulfatase-like hydrolase/transferase [Haloarchaeobius sp. TZWWS8]|uniref:sulfatase-like hydrolase/transferase n=1 Tax=Haloarchaeobius sp. TZWWS8 TaxID=3446121 RepID=UPI003EB97395
MKPNVLLVILDSVRAKNMSIYGHSRETTPFLSQFSDRAYVYEQARSPGSESHNSHASIFTGLHVEEHNIDDVSDKLSPGHSIWESLGEAGYETAVFSSNAFLTEADVGLKDTFGTVVTGERELIPFRDALNPFDYADSFGGADLSSFLADAVMNRRPIRSLLNGLSVKLDTEGVWLPAPIRPRPRSAALYLQQFLNWEQSQDGPWAACINFMDAHLPYEPDADFDKWGDEETRELMEEIGQGVWSFYSGDRDWGQKEALEDLYDGCIRQVDAAIEQLVSALERRDEFDNTMLVIMADHGEGFGERSEIRDVRSSAHGPSGGPEEGILHVPLIAKYPGQTKGGRVSRLATTRHFPRAVDAALDGDQSAEAFTDKEVLSTVTPMRTLAEERASEYLDSFESFKTPTRVLYRDDGEKIVKVLQWGSEIRKYICTDAQTIETTAVSLADETRIGERFEEITDAGVRETVTSEVDSDVMRRLEDLGYA